MDLQLDRKREGERFSDELMHYIDQHVNMISRELSEDFIHDLNTLYTYLVDLKGEFLKCNPTYAKPFGFSIIYNRPSCCPHRITVMHPEETLTIKIKPKNHE